MEVEEGSPAEPLGGAQEGEGGSCLRTCGICCGCTCLVLVLIALSVPFSCSTGLTDGTLSFLSAARPPLTGSYAIGSLRGRLPAGGNRSCGLFVQVTYPMDAALDGFDGQSFPRWRDPVVDRSSRIGGFPECFGHALLGNQQQLDPPGAPLANSEGGWPVVVFSSGLSGALEAYQQLCRDMASTGVIVVALEHEDGAGQYATDCEDNVIEYRPPTRNLNVSEIVEFRRPFLLERVTEYEATMEVLLAGISADGPASSPIMEVLQTGRADQITAVGHSFGACSMWFYQYYLKSIGQATPFVGTVYLDIWATPLTEEEQQAEFASPFVHVTSQSWEALPVIRQQAALHPALLLAAAQTLGTGHQWIADTMYILRYFLARPIGLVGDADVPTIFGATMEAVQSSILAFNDAGLRGALNSTVLGIYPQGLVPIWS